MTHSDVLVIGSGISGLSYSLKIAQQLPDVRITILTKADEDESNTKYAQGGIAIVTDFDNDSFEKHVTDTLIAGDGLCDEKVVRMVVSEGPQRFKELLDWGAQFDQNDVGTYDLGMEGGHSENRILHHKDMTGAEIERALLQALESLPNVTIYEHHFVVDLITEHHLTKMEDPDQLHCYGAYALDRKSGEIEKFTSCITLLATGGAGHVYKNTTNPTIATGDGFGLAYRARALVKNMQFVQFHPTAFYSEKDGRMFLISEAVRGEGAYLKDNSGKRFMFDYDERGELASRDIVARAIDFELKKSGKEHVYLDCTHFDEEVFEKHFPTIYKYCLQQGVNPKTQYIPVVPAMHYMCGGIVVDEHAHTTISHLLAVGECTCTGLHGANRLASNSLLEALVYSHRAAISTLSSIENAKKPISYYESIPEWSSEGTRVNEEMVLITFLRKEIQTLMSDLVGIVRSNLRLEMAFKREREIYEAVQELYKFSKVSPELSELRNLVSVAHLIITQSIEQKENKGGFYNKDLG